jgi:ABC-type branched-subunit amino acid transport system ATPase component
MIEIDGQEVNALRRGFGYAPQEKNAFANLTVVESLQMAIGANLLKLQGSIPTSLRVHVLMWCHHVAQRRPQSAGSMSAGEQ